MTDSLMLCSPAVSFLHHPFKASSRGRLYNLINRCTDKSVWLPSIQPFPLMTATTLSTNPRCLSTIPPHLQIIRNAMNYISPPAKFLFMSNPACRKYFSIAALYAGHPAGNAAISGGRISPLAASRAFLTSHAFCSRDHAPRYYYDFD